MNIPEKYRERYDELAKVHPWMREMRDGATDTPPARDPVEIMRECGGMEHGMGSLRKVLGIECVSGWQMRCLSRLADMIERDYVSRQDFEAQHRTLCAVREQRDGWKAKAERVNEHAEQMEVERNEFSLKLKHEMELNRDNRNAHDLERIAELIAERDEWKAKAEAKSAKRAVAVERLNHSWNAGIRDTRQLFGRLVGGEAPTYAERDDYDALIDLLADDGDCVREDGEMSEVDSRDNGWYLRYDGYMTSKSNYLRISGFKAARALDNRQNLVFVKFMGGKEADCRVYAPKLDVCENLHDSSKETRKPRSEESDSGNVSDSDGENLHVEQDTREKLEADIRARVAYGISTLLYPASANKMTEMLPSLSVDTVIGWLDRQASITRLECAEEHRTRLSELHDLLDEAASERELLRAELTEYKHSHPDAPNQPISQYDAPKSEETAETDALKCDIRDFDDSREKLEADAVAYCDHFLCTQKRFNETKLIALLDRQEAITEREWQESNDRLIGTMRSTSKQYRERIAELQSQLDEVKGMWDEIGRRLDERGLPHGGEDGVR